MLKLADSEVAPDAGVRPGVQDLGSDRGADNLSLDGPTLSEAEEGGFSGLVDRTASKGGFLVERFSRFFMISFLFRPWQDGCC